MREAYFHEDDYGQIQVLPIDNWNHCLSEMKKIEKFSAENFNGFGYTDIYMREGNPQGLVRLNIKIKDLASMLGEILAPYDKVLTGYSSYREEVKNTLAFGSEKSCIVFARYDSNNIVEEIWLDFGLTSQKDKVLASTVLLNLGSIGETFLVDWNLGEMMKLSDRDRILSYFDLREKSHAHALRAMRQYFDNQEKK